MLGNWRNEVEKSHCGRRSGGWGMWVKSLGLGLGAGERGLQQARRLRAKGELSLKCQAEGLTTSPPKPRNIEPNISKFCHVSDVSTRT